MCIALPFLSVIAAIFWYEMCWHQFRDDTKLVWADIRKLAGTRWHRVADERS